MCVCGGGGCESLRSPQIEQGKAAKPQLRERKKHKKPLEDRDSSNEEDWPRAMCGSRAFCTKRPREGWFECQSYKKRAREICTPGRPALTCPNCVSEFSESD